MIYDLSWAKVITGFHEFKCTVNRLVTSNSGQLEHIYLHNETVPVSTSSLTLTNLE